MIGPSGTFAAPTTIEYPAFETAQIKCGNRKCKWRGLETDLLEVPHKKYANATQCACPLCGSDSYYFDQAKS